MSSNNLTWFYSPSYSYKNYILLQLSLHLLTLKQKMYFQLKKPMLLYTLLQTFYCSCWTLLGYEKVKREISNTACTFYKRHTDKFTSPKHTLLVFLVKAYTTWGKGLLEASVAILDTWNISAVAVQQCC